MSRFHKCTHGGVAIVFAAMVVVVIGAMGLALDYARLSDAQTKMQAEADAAALGARDGTWISETEYRVVSEKAVDVTLMALLGYDKVDVKVEAVALFALPGVYYDPPVMVELDPAAMDFNRISVYCFDPATNTRGPMVAIADNNGNSYNYSMPVCEIGQRLELSLHNLRFGRTRPWLRTDPTAENYTYYSDDLGGNEVLETLRCDTLSQCKYMSEGGMIPEGPGRVPMKETRPCAEGKYMYYGWEDRPFGFAADGDFNDIRIIIKCPKEGSNEKRAARLTK